MSDHIAERLRSAADTLKLSGSFDGDVLDAGADEIERLLATHARQADTITRLTREHAEVVARLEVMRAEVVGLRGAATDDALVEVAAQAICGISCSATRRDGSGCECWDWQANELEARAVLAAAGPALVAAERERCAKIAESDSGEPDCPYLTDKPSDPTWEHTDADRCPTCSQTGLEGGTKCRGLARSRIAAAIRTGAPDAR